MPEIVNIKPWEVVKFPWGTAVRHRKGKWTHAFLHPDGQPIRLEHLNVRLHDNGIEFIVEDKKREE